MLCAFGGVTCYERCVYVHCISLWNSWLFVQHKLSRNCGMLIYIHQRVKICQGSGFYVLIDFVWCYLCLGYSNIWVIASISDIYGFLTYVSECGPSVLVCWWNLLSVCVNVGGFLWNCKIKVKTEYTCIITHDLSIFITL